METPQQIQAVHRNGNLHVDIQGHLTPETAGAVGIANVPTKTDVPTNNI